MFQRRNLAYNFILMAFVTLIVLGIALDPSVYAGQIRWYDYREGLATGRAKGKKIYINFRADWCSYCRVMENKTFVDPSVVSFLNEFFIAIKVDSEKEKDIAAEYNVRGLPDNWFMMADGEVIGRRPGYIPPEDFFEILKTIKDQNP